MTKFSNPYESQRWKTSTGLMRPGGLELTQHLLEWSGLRRGARILDLGCGRGGATAYVANAGFEVVGVDQSAALLKEARERYPHLTFIEGDATAIPFASKTFDAVLLECVLSVASTGEILAECARVTGPKGLLMISDVYDRDGVDGPLSQAWWKTQLEANGFYTTYFEDRVRDLQRFAAQLLWETGSLNHLCGCIGFKMPPRPSYFLQIARQEDG